MSNLHPANSLSRTPLLIAATAAALLAGVPACAQKLISEGAPPSDPVLEWSEQLAPRNRFFINNNEDVEVVRFKTPHDVELCAGAGHVTAEGPIRGYALLATWDAQTATINPGNCLAFDARSVKVRAATNLPQDIVLTGSFRVVK